MTFCWLPNGGILLQEKKTPSFRAYTHWEERWEWKCLSGFPRQCAYFPYLEFHSVFQCNLYLFSFQCLRYPYFQVGQNLGTVQPSRPVQPQTLSSPYRAQASAPAPVPAPVHEKPSPPLAQQHHMNRPLQEKPVIAQQSQPVVPNYGYSKKQDLDVSQNSDDSKIMHFSKFYLKKKRNIK